MYNLKFRTCKSLLINLFYSNNKTSKRIIKATLEILIFLFHVISIFAKLALKSNINFILKTEGDIQNVIYGKGGQAVQEKEMVSISNG